MKFFQYLRAIFESFYSKKLYQDVALKWKGRGFFYLFFLILIAASAVSLSWHSFFNNLDTRTYAEPIYNSVIGDEAIPETDKLNRLFHVTSSLPTLTFKNGKLIQPAQGQHVITDPLNNNKALITINSGLHADETQATTPLTIVQDALLVSPPEREPLTLYYDDFMLNDDNWNQLFGLLTDLPQLTIKDGIATIDTPSPHNVKGLTGNSVVYFNVSEGTTIDDIPQSPRPHAAFLRHDMLLFPHKDATPITLSYQQLSKDDLVTAIAAFVDQGAQLIGTTGIIAVFIAALGMFVVCIAITSLLAIVAQAIAKHQQVHHLQYKDCQRLTAIAFTPALIAKAILPVFPLANLVYFLVALFYLYFAVSANKRL